MIENLPKANKIKVFGGSRPITNCCKDPTFRETRHVTLSINTNRLALLHLFAHLLSRVIKLAAAKDLTDKFFFSFPLKMITQLVVAYKVLYD